MIATTRLVFLISCAGELDEYDYTFWKNRQRSVDDTKIEKGNGI